MTGRSTYQYSKTVGTLEVFRGFVYPFDLALGDEDVLYVLNRGQGALQGSIRVTVCTFTTEDFLGDIGGVETGDGRLDWPNSLAIDREGNFYISDEAQQRIFIFDKQGEFLSKWGVSGTGDGEFDRPAGIAFDRDENLLVVDGLNNRVQRYTKDGSFLGSWGRGGNGDGEFNNPWGITVDRTGDVYVADWRNDRIQKFDAQGKHLASWGSSGQGDGEFHRPSGLLLTVMVISTLPTGAMSGSRCLAQMENSLASSGVKPPAKPDGRTNISRVIRRIVRKGRRPTWSLSRNRGPVDIARNASAAIEKLFWGPTSVQVDDEGRIFVTDSCRHRVQIYSKDRRPMLCRLPPS